MNYWLCKSEPDVYSIDQLKEDKVTLWSGVRNYQARNFMRDSMKVGDLVFFYHSNAEPPGIAGLARVSRPAQVDPTALDKKSEYYDPKSTNDSSTWMCVEVEFVEKFSQLISLEQMRQNDRLKTLGTLQKGTRLSVMPVSKEHATELLSMAKQKS